MTPTPSWYTAAARRAKRLARGALRRITGRSPGTPAPRLTGAQEARTGIRRYAKHSSLGLGRPLAAVRAARECLEGGNLAGALRLGHTLLKDADTAQFGHAVLGLSHRWSSSPVQAWEEFAELTDPATIAACGIDYVATGFAVDPATATMTAARLLRELQWPELPGPFGVAIAQHAFSIGDETLARSVVAAAEEGRLGPLEAIRPELDELATWFSDGSRRAPAPPLPADLRFGVLDYRQPAHRSRNLGDYIQSLAGLGLLLRHRGLRFAGDAPLVALVEDLAAQVKPERLLDGPDAIVQLVEVQRDGNPWQGFSQPTWAFMTGWYSHPTFSGGYPLPFHPALRPILLSFHLGHPEALTPEAIEYLRRHGPVGCRDWQTVALLRAAGIPSFFSGCVSMTVDTLFPDTDQSARTRTAFVDPAESPQLDERTDLLAQSGADLRTEPLVANLRRAVEWVGRYHTDYAEVVTSRLHSYLPARAVGCRVRFEPENPSDVCYGGLLELDDPHFDALRQGLLDKSAAVVAWLASGADEDTVYARWRELCAPDVAEAERYLDGFGLARHSLPRPSLPAPPADRLILVDAPYHSQKGVQRLLGSLTEHAPGVPVVVVGPGGEHAEGVRWIRDLPVPERGSAQEQQALMMASVLDSLDSGRVLLLPADAVVRGPLDDLFGIDLGDAALAAREDIRTGRQDISVMLRRIAQRQARNWRGSLAFLAAAHARCGHGGTAFDPRVAVIDPDVLATSGFASLARELIDDYGASLGETLNIVLRGQRAPLTRADHSNVALERPAPGATVISGLSQARMGAHWFG